MYLDFRTEIGLIKSIIVDVVEAGITVGYGRKLLRVKDSDLSPRWISWVVNTHLLINFEVVMNIVKVKDHCSKWAWHCIMMCNENRVYRIDFLLNKYVREIWLTICIPLRSALPPPAFQEHWIPASAYLDEVRHMAGVLQVEATKSHHHDSCLLFDMSKQDVWRLQCTLIRLV